jgi:WhiB family redox-sensing transcriptional regulator
MTQVEIDLRVNNWKLQGSCNSYPYELMWPVGTTGPAEAQTSQAKAVCAACPIETKCLQYAVENHEAYGIWGGLTEEERRQIRNSPSRQLEGAK